VIAVGRPTLDLAMPDGVEAAIAAVAPDLIVNAAAYTAVDKAESEPDLAEAINATGAEAVGRAAARLGVPVIHVSTDYVFDGSKTAPYVESDPVAPLGAYGRSKCEGERRLMAACPRSVVLRTAWVYSPYGHNFVKTMLRLAATRDEVSVVDDQVGNPTYAPHLADAIVAIARRILADGHAPWGLYHAAGTGDVTWCGLAREVFAVSARRGGPTARVKAITTADYPTPARRPANSRLSGAKLRETFGFSLPAWQTGVEDCIARLAEDAASAS
jgi:dTDP-4-dehydrorhamnose reductase